MSTMADQNSSKDALLNKLDNLMHSTHAKKRREPPPVLTDAVPTGNDNAIPTLTDAVDVPDSGVHGRPDQQPQQQAQQQPAGEQAALDTPLQFDAEPPVDAGQDMSAQSQEDTLAESNAAPDSDAPNDFAADAEDDAAGDTVVDVQRSISSRLVAAIDTEMAGLNKKLPAHKGKLAVLHRSLRFALPELVRLRWEEPLPDDADDDSDGSPDAES